MLEIKMLSKFEIDLTIFSQFEKDFQIGLVLSPSDSLTCCAFSYNTNIPNLVNISLGVFKVVYEFLLNWPMALVFFN